MGNTVTTKKNITIVYDASPGNFDIATYFPGEVWLQGVLLNGAGSAATVVVRDSSATGEIITKFSDPNGIGAEDNIIPPKWCKPYIAAADCTLPNGAVVILKIA